MAQVRQLGYWPRTLLDFSDGYQVCPFDGNPPETRVQPLFDLNIGPLPLQYAMYFVWKAKRWRVTVDVTGSFDWVFYFDDNSPNGTGTLNVDLDDTFTLDARDGLEEAGNLIADERYISCRFQHWSDAAGAAGLFPKIYDGGIDLTFNATGTDGGGYSVSNNKVDEDLQNFDVATEIRFVDPPSTLINIQTTFSVNFTNPFTPLEEQFISLYGDPPPGFGDIVSGSATGSVVIEEIESWPYAP